jgi:hypothetical protein
LSIATGVAEAARPTTQKSTRTKNSAQSVQLYETIPFCFVLTVLEGSRRVGLSIHLSANFAVQVSRIRNELANRELAGRASERVRVMSFAVEKSRTIISAMVLGRKVTAQDVAWLRREVFADGEVTLDTAEELFAVARARMNNAPEWTELFVELITDFVVWQSRPTGVVSEDEAQWLIDRADACKSIEALAALVNVLAEAQRAPQWFVAAVRARAAQWPGVEAALRARAG